MIHGLAPILMVVLLLNLVALAGSRIRFVIRVVATQGVLLGTLPLLFHQSLSLREIAMSLSAMTLKGLVIPRMLMHAMSSLPIRREAEPLVGIRSTMLIGATGTGVLIFLATRMPVDGPDTPLVIGASFATIFSGFLLLVGRLKAIMQVLGYLMLENGVFIFGVLLVRATPFLVEAGILLDLFVAVFAMGILLNHISREFTSLDSEKLTALKD